MLEYHALRVGLTRFTDTLAAAPPDPETEQARNEALDAVAAEPGAALLGAFTHLLLEHADSDGAELALLERAADLWRRGTAMCDRVAAIRAALEESLAAPGDPGSPDRFNAAAFDAQALRNDAVAARLEVDALRTEALTFAHLPEHPRQGDLRTDVWRWGDLAAGRRTEALVRRLFRSAQSTLGHAFAVGAAAGYGVHVAGSAFLGHGVGGPRRTHRHRDRLARQAVGAWIAAHHPAADSLSRIADDVAFGSAAAPVLPPELRGTLETALRRTFDLGRTRPIPDLGLGHQRLVRHLTLLDAFALPPSPALPIPVWTAAIFANPGSAPTSVRPQDVDVVGQDGGGVAVQQGPPSTGSGSSSSSDSSTAKKACGIVFLILILVDLVQAFVQCIGQWINGNTCTFWDNMLLSKLWEKDPPDPRDSTGPQQTDMTAAGLTALAASPQGAQMIAMWYDLHCALWEALDRAYAFLAVTGLIYPGPLTGTPVYRQFTSLPAAGLWPHRSEPDAAATYHLPPASPIENPTEDPSPFTAGQNPTVFLDPPGRLVGADVTFALWRQIALGQFDSQNRDLDADRGYLHPCWEAVGSVHDDPVDVRVLGYDEQ